MADAGSQAGGGFVVTMNENGRFEAEEARAALSSAAGAVERGNEPRLWLWAACGALVVAVVFAAVSRGSLASARAAVRVQENQNQTVEQLVKQLQSELQRWSGDEYNPQTPVIGLLRQIAEQTGITPVPDVSDIEDKSLKPDTQVTRRRYEVTLKEQNPEAILRWLDRSTSEIPGLEISQLSLTPGNPFDPAVGIRGWTVQVSFTRWSRRS